MGSTGFYWVLLGFTGFHLISIGFYRVLLDNAKLKGVLTDLTDFYRVFTGFSSVLLGFTMVYWVILGCTWFDRVSICFLRYQKSVMGLLVYLLVIYLLNLVLPSFFFVVAITGLHSYFLGFYCAQCS